MCFTLDWLEHILILAVIVLAIIAILKILIPWALSKFGAAGDFSIVIQMLTICFWAVVIIAVIVFAFTLIGCLLSMGGGFTLMPHR
jgi:hypothetical protein